MPMSSQASHFCDVLPVPRHFRKRKTTCSKPLVGISCETSLPINNISKPEVRYLHYDAIYRGQKNQ